MPSDSSNGTTFTFGTLQSDVVSVNLTINGNPIDLTDLSDTKMVYINGIPDYEVQVTLIGTTSIDPTDSAAALSVAFNDGTTLPSAVNYICTNVSMSAGVNNRIESTLTFKPSV